MIFALKGPKTVSAIIWAVLSIFLILVLIPGAAFAAPKTTDKQSAKTISKNKTTQKTNKTSSNTVPANSNKKDPQNGKNKKSAASSGKNSKSAPASKAEKKTAANKDSSSRKNVNKASRPASEQVLVKNHPADDSWARQALEEEQERKNRNGKSRLQNKNQKKEVAQKSRAVTSSFSEPDDQPPLPANLRAAEAPPLPSSSSKKQQAQRVQNRYEVIKIPPDSTRENKRKAPVIDPKSAEVENQSTAANAPTRINPAPSARMSGTIRTESVNSPPEGKPSKSGPVPIANAPSERKSGENLNSSKIETSRRTGEDSLNEGPPNILGEPNSIEIDSPVDGGVRAAILRQPANFTECVRVALSQSPLFVKTSLEIQNKRLDEHDAWATFVPTLRVETRYLFKRPPQQDPDTWNPWTFNFYTDNYNPIKSAFEIAIRRKIKEVAILNHGKAISEGLYKLGQGFLKLEYARKIWEIALKREKARKDSLDFSKTLLTRGQASPMDVKLAEAQLRLTQSELNKIKLDHTAYLNEIKFILGVSPLIKLDLDLDKGREELIGDFRVEEIDQKKVLSESISMRIAKAESVLQNRRIYVAYYEYMPTFDLLIQTRDSLYVSDNKTTKEFYPELRVQMPINFFTKGRNVARQYVTYSQKRAMEQTLELELVNNFQTALTSYQKTKGTVDLQRNQLELAKLEYEQAEYRFKEGLVDFRGLEDTSNVVDRNMMALAEAEYIQDLSILQIRYLTGDLLSQYINLDNVE